MKHLLLLLVLSFTASCSTSSNKPSWRQMKLEANWIKQIGLKENYRFKKISRSKPLLYKDYVIAGSADDSLAAFKRKTGALKWRFEVPFGVEASPSIYLGNRVIFGGKDGYVYSINADTGKLVWKFFAKAEVLSDLSIVKGVVYVLSGANVLYALDADDGTQKWVYSRVQRTTFSVRGGSKVLSQSGLLYLGFSDGFFVALNASDGSLKWERKLGTNNKLQDVDMSPITDGDSIFVASYDGALYSLNKTDGSVKWRLNEGGFSSPYLDGNKLLFPTTTRKLLLVDAGSGKVDWTLPLKDIGAMPSKVENLWYLNMNSGNSLMIDSVSKKIVARYAPGRGSMAAATFDPELKQIYINSHAGNLHAVKYNWRDRRQVWSWEKGL